MTLGGAPLAPGWTVERHTRSTDGSGYHYFFNPQNVRFRSKVEAAKHYGIFDNAYGGAASKEKNKAKQTKNAANALALAAVPASAPLAVSASSADSKKKKKEKKEKKEKRGGQERPSDGDGLGDAERKKKKKKKKSRRRPGSTSRWTARCSAEATARTSSRTKPWIWTMTPRRFARRAGPRTARAKRGNRAWAKTTPT